jgi:hypothetical protein
MDIKKTDIVLKHYRVLLTKETVIILLVWTLVYIVIEYYFQSKQASNRIKI